MAPRRIRRRRPREDAEKSIEAVRQLLLRADRTRIDHLEQRPPLTTETLAAVLPEAVGESTAMREQELAIALEPTVTRAVTLVARRRPELYGEILAPTIGSAVTRAVAEAIGLMLERLNVALERSLSLRSMKWRLEAARTGRPFAEIVLLRTLRYRVEQIFLIHSPSSIVLQHLTDPTLGTQSPDQVAAMLSAIESFGKDAFAPMAPEAHLTKFELGELSVMVRRDPSIALVAVVRGVPSETFGKEMTEALARIRIKRHAELTPFTGNMSPFDEVRPELVPLLRLERNPPPRTAKRALAVLALLTVAALVAVGSSWEARRTRAEQLHASYLTALENEPGLVVSRPAPQDRSPRFSGFRDPMAAAPEAVVARAGLPPAELAFVPFVSLDPRIVERRARRVLEPPPGVDVALEGAKLRLAGVAPRAWVNDARLLARALPGVEGYDDSALRARESLDAARAIAAEIEAVTIGFGVGQSRIEASQATTLVGLAPRIRAAVQAADEAHLGACLEVVGHTDPPGTVEQNAALSEQRAKNVSAWLVSLGVDETATRAVGAGTGATGTQPARNVTFRLVLDETQRRPGCGGVR